MLNGRLLLVACIAGFAISCRTRQPAPSAQAEKPLWQDVSDTALAAWPIGVLPSAFRLLALDEDRMRRLLPDTAVPAVDMPMPGGGFMAYRITEVATVDKALLEAYPHLRTFSGRAVEDPVSTGRFDMTDGFHGYLITPGGSVIIGPLPAAGSNCYICYFKHHAPDTKQPFEFPADSVLHRE